MDVGENEMIPENIKIDDDGDFKFYPQKHNPLNDAYENEMAKIYKFTFEEIEESYLLAKSKKYPELVKYGCHVDEDKGEVFDDCEIEYENSDYIGCKYAKKLKQQGKCKTDCQYWRPIGVKK